MQEIEVVYLSVLVICLLVAAIASLPPIWQRYFENLRVWFFRQASPFWLVVILLLIIYLTIVWIDGSEKGIRVLGLTLELFGLLFSVQGLLELRVAHGLPPYNKRIQQWLRDFPHLHKSSELGASVTLADMMASGDLEIPILQDDASLTIEERLRRLFHNQNRQYADQRDLSRSLNVLSQKLAAETSKLRAANEDLRTSLTTTMREIDTKGIGKAIFGLVLVAVGLFLSTISQEIANWWGN